MTKREAKRRVWSALFTTLENDIYSVGAGYLYDVGDDADSDKLVSAAEDILAQLERKAVPR